MEKSRRSRNVSALARALCVIALAGAAVLALGVIRSAPVSAQGDARATAQRHYQAGQKAYAAGDYRGAIREFASAEQLVPSGFNDYNLGLCYDKLGEADPAVRYYRSYLDRVSDAKNRSAVEASIARLEAAMASAQAKVEEQRRAEEARKAAEKAAAEKAAAEKAAAEKAAAEKAAAEKAAAEKAAAEKAAAEKAAAEEADGIASGEVQPELPAQPDLPDRATPPGGSQGAPSTKGAPMATGNPQLDRAAAIDLDAIRGERAPLLGLAAPQPAGAGAADPAGGAGAAPPAGGAGGSAGAMGATGSTAPTDKGKSTETPVYKKWWFWVVVGVGAYAVYNIATQDETSTTRRGLESPSATGGATLWSW